MLLNRPFCLRTLLRSCGWVRACYNHSSCDCSPHAYANILIFPDAQTRHHWVSFYCVGDVGCYYQCYCPHFCPYYCYLHLRNFLRGCYRYDHHNLRLQFAFAIYVACMAWKISSIYCCTVLFAAFATGWTTSSD